MVPVHLEYAGRTAIIRLDNPPVNALSAALLKELREAIQRLRQQIEAGDVRAVVVTGNGPKSFVAGADITRFLELDPVSGRELAREGQVIFEELAFLPCPVIAAVNGYALGGGLELAMVCDIRIAAANARLGQPEVNLGLIPGYGGTQRLARLVGPGKAKELIFTGETLLAEEALRIGLVDRVVPEGRALEEALRVAAVIDGKAPLAVRAAKEAINRGLDLPLDKGLEAEAEFFGSLCATEDQKEGARAFLEKRSPQFRGV
ncbi:hypothetical protein D7024_10870 [Desulfofundulus salinus]|uniref:short-chain-enoyl-CoA hydratase n=1 Tax=Desulfofundulus salinus TaxID=2419843 RepID=A0A494X2M3_9FIRM|nr:hypothetical protein D7024_10870 [Desulfofundulus salinum]